MLTRDVQKPV